MNKKFSLRISRFPLHGWMGILLVVLFWWANWFLEGLRTHWAFAPMWIGYCLSVDGLVYLRKKTSLLTRNWRAYLSLYGISVISWWLFEILNWRLQNWNYLGKEYFSELEFAVLASISFSTVVPAVFGTAELAGSYQWIKNLNSRLRIRVTNRTTTMFFMFGWIMLGLLLTWPRFFFAFTWLAVYFIIEPVNVWLGNRTLASQVDKGDWRPVIALWVGALICGFFWEMWNYYSFPKWEYHIPFVGFGQIFEMPILGYGGYLPFAMELFALFHLLAGIVGKKRDWRYVELIPRDEKKEQSDLLLKR